jgi:hypothetical protein
MKDPNSPFAQLCPLMLSSSGSASHPLFFYPSQARLGQAIRPPLWAKLNVWHSRGVRSEPGFGLPEWSRPGSKADM